MDNVEIFDFVEKRGLGNVHGVRQDNKIQVYDVDKYNEMKEALSDIIIFDLEEDYSKAKSSRFKIGLFKKKNKDIGRSELDAMFNDVSKTSDTASLGIKK